ncbi:MAG: RiPP maturation radical SAM C-methyltransferase [Desulfobacterales bacterium]|nr:MAG: RiPP maturation radical SAM C-methyltransferase [Desulfobacterales bacterium]
MKPLKKLVLVSAPWPLFNRPSIQLGTLKAYLRSRFADLQVDAHHVYLQVAEAIGYQDYQMISERTWIAETVYGALLYPERFDRIKTLFLRQTAKKPRLKEIGFEALVSRVKNVSKSYIQSIDWQEYRIAGFSISLCQLTASLYFIKQIKTWSPDLFIVVGGSTFAGSAAQNLFTMFPEIDAVVNGEGERPLSRLVDCLLASDDRRKIPAIPGIITHESLTKETSSSFSQMATLAKLPFPDFDDYFDLLKSFDPRKTFFPTLPIEISRGCWWRPPREAGKSKRCAFCNLNLQWNGYRSKKTKQVVSEIDHLTQKHGTLSVAFTDNLLPLKGSKDIFNHLSKLGKDFEFFGEIRATATRVDLAAMKKAGMREVQIGIEALSSRLLKKLKKGTTTIQNIEIMKHCEMLGIVNSSNLIFYFPSSDREDVAATLRNLEFVLPYRPLKSVPFWLGLGSPVWLDPKAFGLKAVFNHRNYAAIFPPHVFKAMLFIIQGYRGDLVRQRKLWQPVKKKLEQWEKTYALLHNNPWHEPILSFRDGRNFMIIRQKRLQKDPMLHRLEGPSRAIYLFCRNHQAIKTIIDRFPTIAADKIESFLRMMVDKKLMFAEKNRYLSLAVPAAPENRLDL